MAKRKQKDEGGGTAVMDPPQDAQTQGPRAAIEPDLEKILGAESEADAEANGKHEELVPAPPDPAELERQRKAEAFDRIVELTKKAALVHSEYTEAAEEAKGLKKEWEGLVERLQKMILEANDPPAMPLFDGKPGANGEHTPADEAWRAVTLTEAMPDVSEAVIAKLHGANLHTVGELSNWTAEDGGRHRITDVDGIGAATAEKIEEAMTAFWASYKAPPAPETEAEPDAAEEAAEEAGEEAGEDEASE